MTSASVMYRQTSGDFFLRQEGRTMASSYDQVCQTFGQCFVNAVIDQADLWLQFDPDPRAEAAALEARQMRYQVIPADGACDFDGAKLFGIWDRQSGRMTRHFARTTESARHLIDDLSFEIDPPPALPELVAMAEALGHSRRRSYTAAREPAPELTPIPEPQPITATVRKVDWSKWTEPVEPVAIF